MVKAVETSLRELLEGAKQYLVPLYQRTYSWQKAQLSRLWDDLVQLSEDRLSHGTGITHFMGSLVLAPTPDIGPAGVSRYLVVDGQQRLTTLTLLLAAVRDHRAETEDAQHRERLNEQYLVNKWRQDHDRLKLQPTQADRDSYRACIESSPHAGSGDGVGEAYRFFRARLLAHDDPDDDLDIQRLEDATLSGLTLVSVTTSLGDNVHRIFESLNNTGLRLTQGDLLRNYLFMRLPTRGDVVYHTQWLPLQQRLTNDELELLFWLDAVQTDDAVKQTDTYQAQTRRLDALPGEDTIEAEVHRFNRSSQLLELILRPAAEPDPAVRQRLTRLNAWGTTTVYPLLLHLLERRARGEASSAEIANAMLYLESYLVRRVVIGRATNNLNRILLRAVPEVAGQFPADAALRDYLSRGRKFFATDEQVRAGARSTAFYYSGRSPQRKLLLTWLEQTFGSKEPVDPAECTIEHVLPQTLTPAWRDMLKADLADTESLPEVYDSVLHTLGNLTLTGYNSNLGNKPFAKKQPAFASSGFRMNHAIAACPAWTRSEIHRRADDLAERIIGYWPGPNPDAAVDETLLEAWSVMDQALAAMPAGTWTSYGVLAQLIGSHPVPVGARLASRPVPNAHRVLQAQGTTSPNFRWQDPTRTVDQRQALEAEGVRFDDAGQADPAQRLDIDDLAELVGVDAPDEQLLAVTDDTGKHQAFLDQLAAAQSPAATHAVITVLDDWVKRGGSLQYGQADETSCFLMARTGPNSIWPCTLYPTYGSCEIAFQHLKTRPPFDDVAQREELMARLNQAPGVDLPAGKIGLRPSFTLDALAHAPARAAVTDALAWFLAQVNPATTEA